MLWFMCSMVLDHNFAKLAKPAWNGMCIPTRRSGLWCGFIVHEPKQLKCAHHQVPPEALCRFDNDLESGVSVKSVVSVGFTYDLWTLSVRETLPRSYRSRECGMLWWHDLGLYPRIFIMIYLWKLLLHRDVLLKGMKLDSCNVTTSLHGQPSFYITTATAQSCR